jgi:hypothetical protein
MLATAKGHYDGSHIILDSPVPFRRGQEVIVTYALIPLRPSPKPASSVVDSLLGAIPNAGKTLDEYRTERLAKYASPD